MPRVLIDAGHGGRDPGAVKNNLLEKSVTLDLAWRVARNIRLLSKVGDINSKNRIETVLSRDKDIYVDINSRAQSARDNCDLLISIHNNSWIAGSANGARAIVSKTGWYKVRSNNLGKNIIERLTACGLQNKGVVPDKKPWINYNQLGILAGVDKHMPAVLVEVGYLSNSRDAKLLSSADGREVIAIQIAAAAVDSFDIAPRMDLIAG